MLQAEVMLRAKAQTSGERTKLGNLAYLDVTGTSHFGGPGEAWGELRGHARTASRVQPWALVLISNSPRALTARRFRGALRAGVTSSRGEADAPRASLISSLAPAPGVWNSVSGRWGDKPCGDHTTQSTKTRTRATLTCPTRSPLRARTCLPPTCVCGCVTRTSHVRTPNTEGTALVLPELPPGL